MNHKIMSFKFSNALAHLPCATGNLCHYFNDGLVYARARRTAQKKKSPRKASPGSFHCWRAFASRRKSHAINMLHTVLVGVDIPPRKSLNINIQLTVKNSSRRRPSGCVSRSSQKFTKMPTGMLHARHKSHSIGIELCVGWCLRSPFSSYGLIWT